MSAELRLNPRARFWVLRGPDGAQLELPVRGRGLRRERITVDDDPELGRFLKRQAKAWPEGVSPPPALIDRLHELGVLVSEEEIPDEVRYQVPAGPALEALLPPRYRPLDEGRAVTAWVQEEGEGLPPGVLGSASTPRLERKLLGALSSARPVAWRRDPWTDLVAPCWDEAQAPAAPAPEVDPAWTDAVAAAAESWEGKRYATLSRVVPPLLLAGYRALYRRLTVEGYLPRKDCQSDRYFEHNEPASRLIHIGLAPLVARVVGQPVKPSYAFVSAYLGGATLARHTDREQCRFSVTLLIDYTPEPPGISPWPLVLEVAGQPVTLSQEPGDAIFYEGPEIPHWRAGALADGSRSTSLILHYVPEDFSGDLD